MIISISNQKGGVGKTTSTLNLGAALARSGRRVLLIDSDPQANLTSYCGVTPEHTLDEIYLSRQFPDSQTLIHAVPSTAGLFLIPSSDALSGVEFYLFSRPDRELILRRFLKEIEAQFDAILIDTPPSLNLLTLNALCASRGVVIPVQPEFFSLEGIVKIQSAIQNVKERWNPELEIMGVLPTQVTKRRKLTGEVLGALSTEMGSLVFTNSIGESAAIAESSSHARSVMDYQRSSTGSREYQAAALELAERMGLS